MLNVVTFGGYANFRKRCASKHKRFDLENMYGSQERIVWTKCDKARNICAKMGQDCITFIKVFLF